MKESRFKWFSILILTIGIISGLPNITGQIHINSVSKDRHLDSIIIDINSFPSPDEIIHYIKTSNVIYTQEAYNITPTAAYNQTKSQLIALGSYIADMGYAICYEKKGEAISKFSSIEALGKELNVLPPLSYDFRLRFLSNIHNIDSLISIYHELYRWSISHLETTYQYRSMTYVSLGVLIQSLYLVINSIELENISNKIRRRIFDQKCIYDQLLSISEKYLNRNEYEKLRKELDPLTLRFKELKSSKSSLLSCKTRYNHSLIIGKTFNTKTDSKEFELLFNSIEQIRNHWILLK